MGLVISKCRNTWFFNAEIHVFRTSPHGHPSMFIWNSQPKFFVYTRYDTGRTSSIGLSMAYGNLKSIFTLAMETMSHGFHTHKGMQYFKVRMLILVALVHLHTPPQLPPPSSCLKSLHVFCA